MPAALSQKKVPVLVVTDPEQADFEITGTSERYRPLFQDSTTEEATIAVRHRASGVIVFAYAVHLDVSMRGRQSAAESCAKHLKARIESDAKMARDNLTNALGTTPAVPPPVIPAALDRTPATTATNTRQPLRVRVQGDLGNDVLHELRAALAEEGIGLMIMRSEEPYDYNIVVAQDKTNGGGPAAAAVALDTSGNLVASATRSGFTVKGTASGCAKELARRIAAMSNR